MIIYRLYYYAEGEEVNVGYYSTKFKKECVKLDWKFPGLKLYEDEIEVEE